MVNWIEPNNLEGRHFRNKGLQKYQIKVESWKWCKLRVYFSHKKNKSEALCELESTTMGVTYIKSVLWHYVSHGSLSCLPHNKDFWHSSEPHIEEPFSGCMQTCKYMWAKMLLKAKENVYVGKRNSCNKWFWLGHKNGYWKTQKWILKTDYKNLECLMKNLDILF